MELCTAGGLLPTTQQAMIRGNARETVNSQDPTPNPKARLLTRTSVVLMWAVAHLSSWTLGVGRWTLEIERRATDARRGADRLPSHHRQQRREGGAGIEQLKNGADFSKLAQAESLDPSASQGGLIGPIALSELRPDLQAALRTLPVGGVSGVLAASNRLRDRSACRTVLVQLAHARQRGACGFGRQQRQVHAQRGRLLRSRNGTEQPREARGLESELASHLRVPTASR